eukprot:CAMPEP_0194119234 /NCGR_PEP_ID=MMETSP0150-20130528/38516_1 /TAXON_ID=122233 /ORGANISM="Chaetoceros debilis, Strain MM31A-1" /LENGTH=136 /DNA_ID=CAMNT_0038810867 /DNA_START=50 /DNA_END=460 /DNA_ORIENTATION=-
MKIPTASTIIALICALSTASSFSIKSIATKGAPVLNDQSITKALSSTSATLSAAAIGVMTSNPSTAVAYETMEDLEIAELPPVWVPILFAIVIIGGVGLLTFSLGDVMNEEASLGLMSGAKAKKEKERSRSSYFKK